MKRHIALIPAAGVGERFGAGKPKQYVEINDRTVLEHTVGIFTAHPGISLTAVVLAPNDTGFSETRFQTASEKVAVLHCGGGSRAETVRNGLNALLERGLAEAGDNILVHDAARCCLPAEALSRLIDEAGDAEEGGILAVPVADTLKQADEHRRIAATVPRNGLWQAQTPQLFRAGLLQRALETCDLNRITDEASAVEMLGIRPRLVQGDSRNLKLTLPHDEFIVRLLLK
ncbi:2-C-methyl-D-erythritol 4-phosphate cytidylyltransferase [Neisseria zoodegmatis]|uniref:2-C-methyl-D-erythritol 4-phosphate cytidylyltransferase n=1 Tax=Neisseria zoodegmatis TaxID=326523 RepID=A0AB38DQ56_9NEIS|nr:2-C-methyl-D-erythritol 4-phosphate cytidylyltransferase [Neisseria zoodegmatis]OSI08544.1 2-C-methyl-D-erythritol 4-phosphate cytidylyltransferase [Neisseria zoodegmatis]SNU79310.1 2-C-methyl-D-erythritol 4-phosphate cytidylyltransferase [Neisseria zoodegmatis]